MSNLAGAVLRKISMPKAATRKTANERLVCNYCGADITFASLEAYYQHVSIAEPCPED